MTVNVVVATFHGAVLGCDSLSSIVEDAVFPFRGPNHFARTESGEFVRDANGNLCISVDPLNLIQTPTYVTGGVQKMFLLSEGASDSEAEYSVAAVTSGLGTLNGVVIAELANKFRRRERSRAEPVRTAIEVVERFLSFIRPLWETQVGFSSHPPETQGRLSDLAFLVAGYGTEDTSIRVYRVSVSKNSIDQPLENWEHRGAVWAGQSNAVSSLINGIDPSTQLSLQRAFDEVLRVQRLSIADSILTSLQNRGVEIPDGFSAEFQEYLPIDWPWTAGAPDIDWGNLPVQSAVDLTSTLVNAQSAVQKFARGIATVGGRTRIGLMRVGAKFAFLNEPEITHHHVGYNNDA